MKTPVEFEEKVYEEDYAQKLQEFDESCQEGFDLQIAHVIGEF